MEPLGLCAPEDEHVIMACGIHCVQIELKNAVTNAFGEGGLDKVNALQMLHSMHRLQESVTRDEWQHILNLSSEFAFNCNPENIDGGELTPAQRRNRESFHNKHNHVLAFHCKFKKEQVDPSATKLKGTVLSKLQQPTLARWWTVGAAASFFFDHCLVIFHACQTAIDVFDSVQTPNDIASDLFAMMIDVENFVNMVLIRCFNKAHINQHFDWMQSCEDLTQELGCQAHNMAIRFFLTDRDIRGIMWGRSTEDCHKAVKSACKGREDGVTEHTRHFTKLNIFVNEARDLLHKHFPQWTSPKLMPAALSSEGPTACVVAAATLKRHVMPTFAADEGVADLMHAAGKMEFCSEAHKAAVNLTAFDAFIRRQLDSVDGNCSPAVIAAAERLCAGNVNLHETNHADDNGALLWSMHSTCLPVPSILQFVESGVKEAKHVSATDRSEAIQKCLAVVGSCTPLGKAKSINPKLSFNVNRILAVLRSSEMHASPHVQWSNNQECTQ